MSLLSRRAAAGPVDVIDKVLDGAELLVEGEGFAFRKWEDESFILIPTHGSPRDMNGATNLLRMVQRHVSRRKMGARLRITVSNTQPRPSHKVPPRGRETHFYFRNQHELIEWARKEGRDHLRDHTLRWCIVVS